MLLTIIWHGQNATDLSWLLHKRPDRFQSFDLGFGTACVFFPQYQEDRSEASLLLKINSEGLNELFKAKDGEFQYVNPRQYLSSSLLCSAIAKVYSTALKGVCNGKQNAADSRMILKFKLPIFPAELKLYQPPLKPDTFLPGGKNYVWNQF